MYICYAVVYRDLYREMTSSTLQPMNAAQIRRRPYMISYVTGRPVQHPNLVHDPPPTESRHKKKKRVRKKPSTKKTKQITEKAMKKLKSMR